MLLIYCLVASITLTNSIKMQLPTSSGLKNGITNIYPSHLPISEV